MAEIDISLLGKNEPLPEPARPILASHLLELEEKQRSRFSGVGSRDKITTGCGDIDELLGGGLERGILAGLSADGNEARLISLHLLASILISHLDSLTSTHPSKAIIIDTTGSFPLPLLAKILKSRILTAQDLSLRRANQTANYQRGGRGADKQQSSGVDDDVQKCLEMVALSRVFDVEGLWEVLGEVGRHASLESADSLALASGGLSKHKMQGQLPEISDSQEESTSSEEEVTSVVSLEPGKQASGEQGTEIVMIDNITHIINELFARKEKGDAHTIVSLLSQTLHTLSSTQNILIILHNTTVPSKTIYSLALPLVSDKSTAVPPHRKVRQPPSLPRSIFPSNPVKPALGQIFAPLPALHLFLSSLPKSRLDADIVYGQDHDSDPVSIESAEHCIVLEVLKDETPILSTDKEMGRKFGWREQRWTALKLDTDETGFICAFQVKGNMRGIGLEREKMGGLTEVGKMIKVHGWGGRRI